MLSNCESAVEKSQKMLLLNQHEMKNYLKLYHKIECGIIEAENELILCKQKLKSSEYANQQPAYKLETMRNLCKLETEIGNLNSIKDDLSFKLAKRQKQCYDLLNTAQKLQTMFAKEENQITSAIENHLKCKRRSLIQQNWIKPSFKKHEFNNVLAMDSIVAIQTQANNNLINQATTTTLLPNLNQVQHSIASTTQNSPSIFKQTSQFIFTSILKPEVNDSKSEMVSKIKMPKIFLRDVSGKFISKTVKNFEKGNGNKINIKLNKIHFINNPISMNTNYKVLDISDRHANTIITCN